MSVSSQDVLLWTEILDHCWFGQTHPVHGPWGNAWFCWRLHSRARAGSCWFVLKDWSCLMPSMVLRCLSIIFTGDVSSRQPYLGKPHNIQFSDYTQDSNLALYRSWMEALWVAVWTAPDEKKFWFKPTPSNTINHDSLTENLHSRISLAGCLIGLFSVSRHVGAGAWHTAPIGRENRSSRAGGESQKAERRGQCQIQNRGDWDLKGNQAPRRDVDLDKPGRPRLTELIQVRFARRAREILKRCTEKKWVWWVQPHHAKQFAVAACFITCLSITNTPKHLEYPVDPHHLIMWTCGGIYHHNVIRLC